MEAIGIIVLVLVVCGIACIFAAFTPLVWDYFHEQRTKRKLPTLYPEKQRTK